MKFPKLTILFLISLFIVSTAQAQIRFPAGNNSVRDEIAKVMQDYPNHFKSLAGDILLQDPQSTNFTSTIKISGAEDCSVTKYSSGNKEIYSWQAIMLITEDFEEAEKKYKKLYTQLNNMPLKLDKVQPYRFTALYEPPTESRKFNTILFSASESEVKKLKLELSMRFEFPEWKVSMMVYEREREDDERGPLKEDGE